MIDTVNFYLNSVYIGDYTPTLHALTDVKATKTERGFYTCGKCGNYTVYVKESGVSVIGGSLCKWYLGDNLQMLDRHSTKEAVNALSDTLHIDLTQAQVTRLDWGANIATPYTFASYSDQLQEMPNASKHSCASSLCYIKKGGKVEFALYDKVKEANTHKESVPTWLERANVVRLEYRALKGVKQVLQESEVTGATIYSPTVYPKLIQIWKETFLSIETQTTNNQNYTLMSLKEMQDYFVAQGIFQNGGLERAKTLIKDAQKSGALTKMEAKRKRDYLTRVCETYKATEGKSEAVKELTNRVKAFARLAR